MMEHFNPSHPNLVPNHNGHPVRGAKEPFRHFCRIYLRAIYSQFVYKSSTAKIRSLCPLYCIALVVRLALDCFPGFLNATHYQMRSSSFSVHKIARPMDQWTNPPQEKDFVAPFPLWTIHKGRPHQGGGGLAQKQT